MVGEGGGVGEEDRHTTCKYTRTWYKEDSWCERIWLGRGRECGEGGYTFLSYVLRP